MGLHQTKKFFTAKEIINYIKRQPTEWENIFTNTSDKGLHPTTTATINNLLKKWAKDLNRHFSKEDI